MDSTASRDSVYSVTGCPEKASAMCCSTEELDSTNCSCLSPLLFPTRRKQALAVFEGDGRTTSEWGSTWQAASRYKEGKAACDRKTDKAKEWKELWQPKFIAQIGNIHTYVPVCCMSHRGTQLLLATNSISHLI